MTTPAPFNSGEPVAVFGDRGIVTMVEGTTFCICTHSGDVDPGGAQGFYYRDARMVSRWQLRVDGQQPQPLSVLDSDAFTARFVLRRPPRPGHPDSTLLVLRERTIGEGMREVITLMNVGRETTVVRVDLGVDADFADLFAVKEGHPGTGMPIAQSAVGGVDLIFSRVDSSRGLLVHASGEPRTGNGGLTWQAVVPPRSQWTTEIVAQPMLDNRRIEPRFREIAEVPSEEGPLKWRDRITRLHVQHSGLSHVLRRSVRDLDALRIADPEERGRTYIAAGAPWFMTLFGRDSLLTSWMALPLDNQLAVGTLQTLAAYQGRHMDARTEEQPGRILHELRMGPEVMSALGGMNYYGTVDATPLFVALLGEAWRWGATDVDVRGLLPAADAALSWLDRYGDRDGDGFVEYRRATDRGLVNQGWKDSFDGVNDASGHLAEPPVALAEVQGYVFAAWLARAELAEAFGDGERAKELRDRAEQLKQRFAEQFWLPDQGWPAIALDGHKRPVDALTSNPGHCLWTGILTDDQAAQLISRFGSEDMDSGYGLRTLSARMAAYNPMSYHNGSVWPHDTAIAIAGLMRYAHLPGAVEVAHRLASGLIDAANAFGGRLPELYCGFPRSSFDPPVPYPTSCSPQAWASAAPLLLVRAFLGLEPDVPNKVLRLHPRLPQRWGKVTLDRLVLDGANVRVVASDRDGDVTGLPDDWTVDFSS